MSSIVIAYEDDYHEELHLLIKALRRDRGLPGLILEGRPVRGTGKFGHEVPSRCPDLERLLGMLAL